MNTLVYQRDGYEIYYDGNHFLLIRRLPDGRYQNPKVPEDADETRKKANTSDEFNPSECTNFRNITSATAYINRIEKQS